MTTREQLEKAAAQLEADKAISCWQARQAFADHLRMIAEVVGQLERAGLTVALDLKIRAYGLSSVKLMRKSHEYEVYRACYDPFEKDFEDDWKPVLKEKLRLAIAMAKMFS